MFLPAVDLRRLVDGIRLPVHADPDVSRGASLFPQGLVALAVAEFERGHQVQLRAGRPVHYLGDDLVGRLAADGDIAGRAVRPPQPRHQNPQIVVDFRDGADGAPRRMSGPLLLDRHGGREPLDVVHLRLLHLADELPGVCAEAFDVSPLALGIDRVDGQRGFARPAGAAADGQPVAGDIDVDAFQVVLSGAADADSGRWGRNV